MSGEAVPSREKYWNELNAHERVSRMRGIVKAQGNKIKELEQQVRNLMEHSHNGSEITVPLKKEDGNCCQTGPVEFMRIPTPEEDEKVYF